MSDARANEVIRRFDRLEGERGTWKQHWQECATYMLPNRADYTSAYSPGQKMQQNVFDSAPLWALDMFASGLHGMLTSPTLRWFELEADDDAVNADEQSAIWLDATAEAMYSVFNGPAHNFAAQSHEFYLDLGCIGTGVMAVLESTRSGVLFSTRHLKECVIEENEEDRVDALTRQWEWTAKQAWDRWGADAGEAVVKAMDGTPDRKFTFLHSVRPRRARDPRRADRKHMPFESIWVCKDGKNTIDEGGYEEFPYLVARLSKRTGETYGRGRGMVALPDVKMLNEMLRTVLKSAQKIVDPPLQAPDDSFLLPLKTVPGSVNYYRPGSRDRIEPILTNGQVQIGTEMLDRLENRINRIFYVDMLLTPTNPADPASAGKGVTATFTLHQRDQQFALLSPMLARQQTEFLGPLIDRAFAIMWRQSVARRFGPGSFLTPPPPRLAGAKLRVKYVSPIATAQRTSQIDSIARLVQMATMLGTVDPAAPRALDGQAILRLTARDLHTPAIALKSPDQVQQEMQAEQQAAAAQAQTGQLAGMARAAKDGSGAVANIAQLMPQQGQAA